jgi:2'-5' RNA ligase
MHPSVNKCDPLYDMSFDKYNQRQVNEVSSIRATESVMDARKAGHFNFINNQWIPNPYEGFAMITMLSDHPANVLLSGRLVNIQSTIYDKIVSKNSLFLLPKESFHQTIANCLSANRYKNTITENGLEQEIPEIISSVLKQMNNAEDAPSLKMKMIGLGVFSTAIGLLGIFENANDYQRVLDFRKKFYGNEKVAELGIQMTRPFIGHITLAYIEENISKNEKDELAKIINNINSQLKEESNYFFLHQTTLMYYSHLAEFCREPHFTTHLL